MLTVRQKARDLPDILDKHPLKVNTVKAGHPPQISRRDGVKDENLRLNIIAACQMLLMLVKTSVQINSFDQNYYSIYCKIPNPREILVQELQKKNYSKKNVPRLMEKHSILSQCECKPKVI